MIFGMVVTGMMVLAVGVPLFLLILFEVLLGRRIFKLGKKHWVVHRWTGYGIAATAALHGLFGVLFVTGARIG